MPYGKATKRTHSLGAPYSKRRRFVSKKLKDVKFYGTGAAAQSVADTGSFLDVTKIPSGAADLQRVGNRIQPIYMRYRFNIGPSDNTNTVRVIFFRSKGGPRTSVAACFQGGAANVDDLLDYGKVQVLVDRTASISKHEVAAAAYDAAPIIIQGTFKVNFGMEYESSATGDAQKNAIQCIVISDSSAPGHPTADWATQLIYRDA